jgi:sporulation protein YlmC with PRC-barrel domain
MPDRPRIPMKMMLAGELLGSRVVDTREKIVGHVADLQISPQPPYEVQGLFYGTRGWMHRFHVPDEASRRHSACFVPWDAIARLEPGMVLLKADWQP